MDAKKQYALWRAQRLPDDMAAELAAMAGNADAIEGAFGAELQFGTARSAALCRSQACADCSIPGVAAGPTLAAGRFRADASNDPNGAFFCAACGALSCSTPFCDMRFDGASRSGNAVSAARCRTNFVRSGGYGASCSVQIKTSVTRPSLFAPNRPTGTTTNAPASSGTPPVRYAYAAPFSRNCTIQY